MSHEKWLRQLTSLNKARNNAPHKPLLLLVFLDMVEAGEYVDGPLYRTAALAYRFNTYAKIVGHRRTAPPDVRYPFHHLSSQKFWTAHMENGAPSKHRSTTEYVLPDLSFMAACRDPQFRHEARLILILTHFPDPAERNALYHLLGMPTPQMDEASRDAFFKKPKDAENAGRTARFRLDVVPAYDYTCALTRYRMTTVSSGAIVDAAHIHQFSESRNNDPSNGLALCKNAHWQFDHGLWSLDDNLCVVVATEKFIEHSPHQTPLAEFHGTRIHLPSNELIWLSKVHLAWHRKTKFDRAS